MAATEIDRTANCWHAASSRSAFVVENELRIKRFSIFVLPSNSVFSCTKCACNICISHRKRNSNWLTANRSALRNGYKINMQLIAFCLRAHQTFFGWKILIQYIQITDAFMIQTKSSPSKSIRRSANIIIKYADRRRLKWMEWRNTRNGNENIE